MAAVLITVINLIGGIVVGMLQHGLPFEPGHAPLLAADGRRRPRRPDPGAADLGRHRHPRHPLGLREGPRQRHRPTDPAPAQGADGRRRRDHRVRARAGSPEASVPVHRRDVRRGRLGGAQRPARRASGSRAATPALPLPRRAEAPAVQGHRDQGTAARPARARDRLRPRAARRPPQRRRHARPPRVDDPPPDRGRARNGDPAGAHPRRDRPRLARVRLQGPRLGGRARPDHARSSAGDGPRRRRRNTSPGSRPPSPHSACRRSGSPRTSTPRPRRSATRSSTASR